MQTFGTLIETQRDHNGMVLDIRTVLANPVWSGDKGMISKHESTGDTIEMAQRLPLQLCQSLMPIAKVSSVNSAEVKKLDSVFVPMFIPQSNAAALFRTIAGFNWSSSSLVQHNATSVRRFQSGVFQLEQLLISSTHLSQ